MNRPEDGEYAPFYAKYIALTKEGNGLEALKHSGILFERLLATIPVKKATYCYTPGKCSVNEVVQHVIDAELIFAYRALCIARGDKTPLPGFDENTYAPNSGANGKSLTNISDFFKQTRQMSISLFRSFEPKTYVNLGTASNAQVSVRALCFIISGHCIHHANILQQRYL